MEEVVLIDKPSHKDLLRAISLKCSNPYGAMSMLNALGGTQDTPWKLCHAFKLKDLIDEATRRGLSLDDVKTSCEPQPVKESMYYKRATGEWTEEQFQVEFRKWQKGGK
jgi:hypothetical protein